MHHTEIGYVLGILGLDFIIFIKKASYTSFSIYMEYIPTNLLFVVC